MIHGCNEHFYSKHSTQQRLSSDLEHWQCWLRRLCVSEPPRLAG
jgi:hypothetical protein